MKEGSRKLKLIEKNIFPLFYYSLIYISSRNLKLLPNVSKGINVVGIVLVSIFVIRFLASAVKYWLINYAFKKEEDNEAYPEWKTKNTEYSLDLGLTFIFD